MTKRTKRVVVALVSVAIFIVGVGPASASSKTVLGCPSGYTCVYKPGGIDNSSPTYKFYNYGYHNLSGMTGQGAIVDNQTGVTNIGTYWCSGYGGTGTVLGGASGPNNPPSYVAIHDPVDLTPINSVILTTHYVQFPPASCDNIQY